MTYFQPRDWVIGAGACGDDFQDVVGGIARSFDNFELLTSPTGPVVLLVLAIASILTTRGVTRPLAAVVAHLGLISKGDLSKDVSSAALARRDETGELARALQSVSGSLRGVLEDVSGGVQTLAASATEMSAVSSQMASGSSAAAARTAAVATAAEEMSATAFSVAQGMEQAATSLASVATATEQMSATIGDIAASIAAAMEEQTTVSKAMARSIVEASAGVREANHRTAESVVVIQRCEGHRRRQRRDGEHDGGERQRPEQCRGRVGSSES